MERYPYREGSNFRRKEGKGVKERHRKEKERSQRKNRG